MISGYQLLFEAEVVKSAVLSQRPASAWEQVGQALRQVGLVYIQAVESMVEAIGRLGTSLRRGGQGPAGMTSRSAA